MLCVSSPLDGGRSIHDDVLGTYQFPTLLEPCTRDVAADLGAALDWAHRSRYDIEARLAATGALLFRGFPIDSAEHFAKFVEALGYPNFAYQGAGGNAVRENVVGDRVFTANESPPDRVIPFHHELAQTPVFPHRVLFFCDIPAATGGATPLLDSHRVYTRIRDQLPEFMEELETKGVRYTRVMTRDDRPDSAVGRGWAGTFGVETLDQLRAALDGTGQSFEILVDVPGVDPTRCPIRHYTSTLAAIGWTTPIRGARALLQPTPRGARRVARRTESARDERRVRRRLANPRGRDGGGGARARGGGGGGAVETRRRHVAQ